MSQRGSGYPRVPDEQYETITWPVLALLQHLPGINHVWDPCDRGSGKLVDALLVRKINAYGTEHDFLTITEAPCRTDAIITNPPYGERRRGEKAVAFVEHALTLEVPYVAMLLRTVFDGAITRQHLFRNEPRFAFKLVLLNRIKWFDGPSSPSDNHAWFVWNQANKEMPTIRYISREEALR
jgi:hypothetical protein